MEKKTFEILHDINGGEYGGTLIIIANNVSVIDDPNEMGLIKNREDAFYEYILADGVIIKMRDRVLSIKESD